METRRPPPSRRRSSSSYLADVGALGLGGPGDDAGHGQPGLAGVAEVGRVHEAGQSLDVAQDGHLHLQVGRLRLVHDEAHQDVELLLVGERLPEEEQEEEQSQRRTHTVQSGHPADRTPPPTWSHPGPSGPWPGPSPAGLLPSSSAAE